MRGALPALGFFVCAVPIRPNRRRSRSDTTPGIDIKRFKRAAADFQNGRVGMFSSLWLKSTLTLLFLALIVMGSCKMMKMAGCGKRKPRPPRPPKIESFDVVSVSTGNSIIVKAGRRDRTITVTLKGIGVPDLPGATEAARATPAIWSAAMCRPMRAFRQSSELTMTADR